MTESDGVWGNPVELQLDVPDLDGAHLFDVSCRARGCMAVGRGAKGFFEPITLVATGKGANWRLDPGLPEAVLMWGVSCVRNACTVVAHGAGGPGGLGSFTATKLRGTWSVTPLPGLPFADSSDLVPSAISCFAQRCMVVGNFFLGQEGEEVVSYETAVHGVWHTAHAITFPNGNLYQLEAQSVSCTSHACVIGGGAFSNPGGFAATVTQ